MDVLHDTYRLICYNYQKTIESYNLLANWEGLSMIRMTLCQLINIIIRRMDHGSREW